MEQGYYPDIPEAKREQGEVPEAIGALAGIASELESDVRELDARLRSVVREQGEVDARLEIPRGIRHTPVGAQLEATYLSLRNTQANLRSLLERLEI